MVNDYELPKVLLFGSQGQVGWELIRALSTFANVVALGRTELDLVDINSIRSIISESNASIIINASAYTQVDKAEIEPDLAIKVNALAPEIMAIEAARIGALFIHYSTDSVFDGRRIGKSYLETDMTNPHTMYAKSKFMGEQAVLLANPLAYVFRIGWVYSLRGNNFLTTIMRLTSENDELRVVSDQWGSPTWARMVAEATSIIVSKLQDEKMKSIPLSKPGIYHMASSDNSTWHEFATEIVGLTRATMQKNKIIVHSIGTDDYPSAVRRPMWSVLNSRKLKDSFGVELPSWSAQLKLCLSEMHS